MPRPSPLVGLLRLTGWIFRQVTGSVAALFQLAHRRPKAFVALLLGAGAVSWVAVQWSYHGFLPHDPSARTLKAMLGVDRLPASLRLSHLEREYFPDLSVEADFRIAPSDLERVLEQASFQPYNVMPWEKATLTQAYYIPSYEGFPVDSRWRGRRSLLTVNRERNRVFLISIQ